MSQTKTWFYRVTELLVMFLAIIPSGSLLHAQTDAGTIEGRVYSAATHKALVNARVILEGTNREMLTDETGAFRFAQVAAGGRKIVVSYLGLEGASETVTVPPGGRVTREFNLARGAPRAPGETAPVQLSEFRVVADSEMSAQDIAVNEQRYAPNIKNVVAIDEFGDRGNENIGEFLLFVPGVAIENSGPDPASASVRGFPANNTGLLIDGGEVAGSFTENSRALDLREVPMTNISRVEVTKVPTPDTPASGLGGTINLISKSGFETKRPTFTYQVYALLHNNGDFTFKGSRNHSPETSPDYREPSFNVSYLHPFNQSVAVSLGVSRTFKYKPMEDGGDEFSDVRPVWDQVRGVQRQSRWYSLAQLTETFSTQLGFDWRISSHGTLSASFQHRDHSLVTTRSNLDVNYGAGVTGGATFSQGAATGVGVANQGNNGSNGLTATESKVVTLRYRHRGDVWRIDAAAFGSRADNDRSDVSRGFFNLFPSSIENLVIRGDNLLPDGIPTRYTATTRAGAPVNIFDGGNYSILRGQSDESERMTRKTSARLDLARDFSVRLPITVKTGLSVDRMVKDERRYPVQYDFRPNGATDAESRRAGRFDVFDDAFNASAPPIYGVPMRWISPVKVRRLYEDHPNWFVINESAAWQNLVNGSRKLSEMVSAGYVRLDLRLLQNRLWAVAGVRYERTDVEGWGRLDDNASQWVRDARGNYVLNPAGQRILITTDPLERIKLRFKERGSHGKRDYGDFYPSFNATYNISDNLLVRGAYARTLGRPDLNFIVPGAGISDPLATNPLITVSNPGLAPWTANNYDLSFESYYLKDGFGSVGIFQKDIKNFFNTVTTPATRELLVQYGLDSDPLLLDYDIRTQENGGSARIRGLEFGYRQSLTFLPRWARGLQLFVNYTKLDLDGDRTADFDGFNPEVLSGGLNFIRERYYLKVTVASTGELQRASVAPNAANGIPANTFDYQAARTRWSVTGQYSFSRRFALYGSIIDVGGLESQLKRYDPNTPEYARTSVYQKLGYYLTVGVKGSF
jgi:iron complex outermembrane receptor protein